LIVFFYENYIQEKNINLEKLLETCNFTKEELNHFQEETMESENNRRYILHNPTYYETLSFLENDTTDKNSSYTYKEFGNNCAHFSRNVNNNSEQNGILCGYVVINFENGYPHAIVAYNTTDQGLVFFEPQTDEKVNLSIGYDYWTQCVINSSGTDYQSLYGSIIKNYEVYW